MRFKGIVFDFNGVLWWDTPLQEQAWQEYSARLRGAPLSREELALHTYGRPNRHTLEYLLGQPLSDSQVWQMVQEKEGLYRALCLELGEGFRLSPGAAELLDYLAQRAIPRTIATASEKTNLDFFFQHLDLGRWFSLELVVYDDGLLPGKPAPDIYLQAAARLGLRPTECVVVEDSLSGLQAARAAGAGYLIALNPTQAHLPVAVDEILDSLADFPRERLF